MLQINISIVKPTSEHVADISKICSTGWQQTVKNSRSEEYQKKNIACWYNHKKVHEDIMKGLYTHVAIIDDKVVGTIGGVMSKDNISEIYVFYVDERFRYQGIGKKLIDRFTQEHVKRGATQQYVSVEEGNKLGLPFYKARGFQFEENIERYRREIY